MLALDVRRGNPLLFGGAGGPKLPPQLFADTWSTRCRGRLEPGRKRRTLPANRRRWPAAARSRGSGSPGLLFCTEASMPPAHAPATPGCGWTNVDCPPLASDPVRPLHRSPQPCRCRNAAARLPHPRHRVVAAGPAHRRTPGPAGPAECGDRQQRLAVGWRRMEPRLRIPAADRPSPLRHFAGSAAAAAAGWRWSPFGDSASGLRQDSFLLDRKTGQFAPQFGSAPPLRSEAAVAYDEERDEVQPLRRPRPGRPTRRLVQLHPGHRLARPSIIATRNAPRNLAAKLGYDALHAHPRDYRSSATAPSRL